MPTRKCWIIHFTTLTIIVIWALLDLRFEAMVGPLKSLFVSPQLSLQANANNVGVARIVCLGALGAVASSTFVWILAAQFQSGKPSRSRSIASMLAITTTIALWFGVVLNHSSLAWQGKRIRVAMHVQQLESLTASLRTDWPERDGDLPGIGPFMAYPFGRPTTLVLLQSPVVSGESLHIAAIERQRDGAILLQLSGSNASAVNRDDWVEWHPPHSEPQSFVGGLSDFHQFQSSARLGRGWYLVRYQHGSGERQLVGASNAHFLPATAFVGKTIFRQSS